MDKLETSEEDTSRSTSLRPDRCLGVRHLQTGLVSLMFIFSFTLRVNMSVAIVAMIDKENANPDYPEYPWDEKVRALILSSFFWGYILPQVFAGFLSERYGSKWPLVGAMFVSALLAILTPWMAEWGDWPLVCAVRVAQGFAQGFVYPSVHNLLSKWSPVDERATLATIVYSGAQFGTFLALPICGLLSTSALGWPSNFYIFGVLGILWCLLWIPLGSSTPADSKLISPEELEYIEKNVYSTGFQGKLPTPWKAILTSLPVWSIVIAFCGHAWGFWTLLTQIPTYLKTVLHFELEANGILSALPYLANWLLSFVYSWISGLILSHKLVSLRTSRKIFNSLSQWGAAATLIGLAYTTDPTLVIVLLTLAVGLLGTITVSCNVNIIDLAPNFSGTVMGFANGSAAIMSIIAPLVVGVVVTEEGSVSQWRIVFFIAAGLFFLTNLFFVTFGKAEHQPWNDSVQPQVPSSKTDCNNTNNTEIEMR